MNRKSLLKLAAAACCVILLTIGRADGQTPISACGTTISTPGPYVLTANLSNVGKSAPCITVNVTEVKIDLAGYTISGSGAQYYGIWGAADMTVRNGTIKSFAVGIYAPSALGVRLESMNVVANAHQGALLGNYARVSGSLFRNNGGRNLGDDGLDVGAGSVVTNSTFDSNGDKGLSAGGGASVAGCTAASNGGNGIATAGGATLEKNESSNNGHNSPVGASVDFYDFYDSGSGTSYRRNAASGGLGGFVVEGGTTFIANTAVGNDGGFGDNGSSTYVGNTAAGNTGNGFAEGFPGGDGDTYAGNTADGNGTGGTGYGFNVVCPADLVGNAAQGNKTGAFNNLNSGGTCNKVDNLGF